jgi:hypothetical protein
VQIHGTAYPKGKTQVALGALRHGLHVPSFLSALGKSGRASEEFRGLYLALDAALLPDKTDETAMDLLKRTVLQVRAMKQKLMRWAASRAEREAWFAKTSGVFPLPKQWLILRPGGRVRVSFWVRRGRGRGRRRLLQTGTAWEEGRARLHVVVTVTASIGHPLLGCSSLEEIPEGVAPRVVFKRKPECVRKHRGSQNMIELSRIGAPFSQGAAPYQTHPMARSLNAPMTHSLNTSEGRHYLDPQFLEIGIRRSRQRAHSGARNSLSEVDLRM